MDLRMFCLDIYNIYIPNKARHCSECYPPMFESVVNGKLEFLDLKSEYKLAHGDVNWIKNKWDAQFRLEREKYEAALKENEALKKMNYVPDIFHKKKTMDLSEMITEEKEKYWARQFAAIQRTERQEHSSRYFNYIQFQLVDNKTCKMMTGCDRYEILNQARWCDLDPQKVYLVRMKIKLNLPHDIIAAFHGQSAGAFSKIWKECIKALEYKYADRFLVNDGHFDQHFKRANINKHYTPQYVKELFDVGENQNIYLMDSTYQYIAQLHSDHEMSRALYCHYKNKKHLIKVHIYKCADGKPIYPVFTFANVTDGQIFQANMDKEYVEEAKEEFASESIRKELLYLQTLITIEDKCIADDGYRLVDPRLHSRNKIKHRKQKIEDTVNIRFHIRLQNTVRSGDERTHRRAKCFKMLHDTCNFVLLKDIMACWKIVLADLVVKDWKSNEDTETMLNLKEKLIDNGTILYNPGDLYLQKKYTHRFGTNTEEEVDLRDEEQKEEDDELRELQDEINKFAALWNKWKIEEKELEKSLEYLRGNERLTELMDEVREREVYLIIGRKFENINALSYLRRILYEVQNFTIMKNRNKHAVDWVYKFKLVKSKHKSTRSYEVVLDFTQIYLWKLSAKCFWKIKNIDLSTVGLCRQYLLDNNFEVPEEMNNLEELWMHIMEKIGCELPPKNERHWLLHLLHNRPVSEFLDQRYHDIEAYLHKKRMFVLKKEQRVADVAGFDLNKMSREQMREIAREKGIQIPYSRNTITKIRSYLRIHLVVAQQQEEARQPIRIDWTKMPANEKNATDVARFVDTNYVFSYALGTSESYSGLKLTVLKHLVRKQHWCWDAEEFQLKSRSKQLLAWNICAKWQEVCNAASMTNDLWTQFPDKWSPVGPLRDFIKTSKIYERYLEVQRTYNNLPKEKLKELAVKHKIMTAEEITACKDEKARIAWTVCRNLKRQHCTDDVCLQLQAVDWTQMPDTWTPAKDIEIFVTTQKVWFRYLGVEKDYRLLRRDLEDIVRREKVLTEEIITGCKQNKAKLAWHVCKALRDEEQGIENCTRQDVNMDANMDIEDNTEWRQRPEYKYLTAYPKKAKNWFDQNFKLIGGSLSRLIWSCQCGAGIQIQGLCGHAAAILLLVYHCAAEGTDLNTLLARKPTNQQIHDKLMKFKPYKQYRVKTNADQKLGWCRKCQNDPEEDDRVLYMCDGCRCWWHAECLGQKSSYIEANPDLKAIWMCPNENTERVFSLRRDEMMDELDPDRTHLINNFVWGSGALEQREESESE